MIKFQQGALRWCETSTAPPRAARTFLQLYPEAKITCFHRSCRGYIAAAGGRDEPAAAAGQWLAHTEPLLEMERGRPGQCLRVRHEDLAAGTGAAAAVFSFLGLGRPPAGTARPCARLPDGPPGSRIGAQLLGQVNRLHAELGYPPM